MIGIKHTKGRKPLQVSDRFLQRLKEMQKKMRMTTGDDVSLRAITDEIVSSPVFNELERSLMQKGNINLDIRVKMDARRLI